MTNNTDTVGYATTNSFHP